MHECITLIHQDRQPLLPLQTDFAMVAWTGGERQLAMFCSQAAYCEHGWRPFSLPATHREPVLPASLLFPPGVFALVSFQWHHPQSAFLLLPSRETVCSWFLLASCLLIPNWFWCLTVLASSPGTRSPFRSLMMYLGGFSLFELQIVRVPRSHREGRTYCMYTCVYVWAYICMYTYVISLHHYRAILWEICSHICLS